MNKGSEHISCSLLHSLPLASASVQQRCAHTDTHAYICTFWSRCMYNIRILGIMYYVLAVPDVSYSSVPPKPPTLSYFSFTASTRHNAKDKF